MSESQTRDLRRRGDGGTGARRRRALRAGKFGGDAFNTAIYLARAGVATAFASALGDDPYSDAIVSLAEADGVATDLVLRVAGRLPALSLIDADAEGEPPRPRLARGGAGARPVRIAELEPRGGRPARRGCSSIFPASRCRFIPISGSAAFLAAVELARGNGAKVAFDGNFRPRDWKGDLTRTRTVFAEALKRVDIALPAYDDEAVLWGDPSPEATIERLQAFGVAEVVVKNGPNSALIALAGKREAVPVPEVVVPVDATAAGDGFNAGYLAARLNGRGALEAAEAAHKLAGAVIRHRGAIMPRAGAAVH